jgi:hypothetical protein
MLRVVFLFDNDETRVADNVRIGHDSIAVDHEPCAYSDGHRSRVPWHFVVRLLGGRSDANEAFPDFDCFGNLRDCVRDDKKNGD